MNRVNVKLTLSYDGTNYFGFQTQESGNAVADKLISSISKIEGENVEITCAGRTDSGVHAEGQVVNFFTSKVKLNENSWRDAINSSLPKDIQVIEAEFVPDTFNARTSACFREYWYKIVNAPVMPPLSVRFALHYKYPLDLELMKKYCPELLGEQDFTVFSAVTDTNISKKRFVYSASLEKDEDIVTFKITANAYLHNMIRIIVGTFLKFQKEKRPPEEIKKILLSRDRTLAGPTISPKGLVFKKVYYPDDL